MRQIYLDNAATMPIAAETLKEMYEAYQSDFANPSSLHKLGYEVEKKITKSREVFAKILGASASEIFFTSGGTESNNFALFGLARANQRNGKHIISVKTEHPSVLEALYRLESEGFLVDFLEVGSDGIVSEEELVSKLREDTILVSIMTVNNETGVIQPVEKLFERVKQYSDKILVHSDCVQTFGKIAMPNLKNIDCVSLGAHKIGGPKGIGLLYLRKGVKIQSLLVGGKHQLGLRAGTENYPLVQGFTVAAQMAVEKQKERYELAFRCRQTLLQELKELDAEVELHGGEAACPFIINLGFPKVRGEVLLHSLEEEGIYISTGSACKSKKNKISHVMEAMNVENKEGSVRISLGYQNTEEEMRILAPILAQKVKMLQRFVRK